MKANICSQNASNPGPLPNWVWCEKLNFKRRRLFAEKKAKYEKKVQLSFFLEKGSSKHGFFFLFTSVFVSGVSFLPFSWQGRQTTSLKKGRSKHQTRHPKIDLAALIFDLVDLCTHFWSLFSVFPGDFGCLIFVEGLFRTDLTFVLCSPWCSAQDNTENQLVSSSTSLEG